MINDGIREREVRVIDQDGKQLGIMATQKAILLAEEAQLDLVKISPNSKPPVCKFMDYDKYRYEQAKRVRELRKSQKIISLKEVQLSVTIEENDLQTKVRNALRFLENGDKVKVVIRFRGRQIAHTEIGLQVMNTFFDRVKDFSTIERRPNVEGRNMIMILAPTAEKKSFAEKSIQRAKANQQ